MVNELSEMTLEELWELFPIILKEHNEDYAKWYIEEEQALRYILNEDAIYRISHIGSTAVKHLVAKPTVDILLELRSTIHMQEIIDIISNHGWIVMSQETEPYVSYVLNKGYTPHGFADKVYHLHVRYAGDWNELYFRDYLREHADIARAYGELKISLSTSYKLNRDGYTMAKTDFISRYTEEGRVLYKQRYVVKE